MNCQRTIQTNRSIIAVVSLIGITVILPAISGILAGCSADLKISNTTLQAKSTEERVQAVYQQILDAHEQRDAKTIASHLSHTFRLHTYWEDGSTRTENLVEYLESLAELFGKAESIKFDVTDVSVKESDDGQSAVLRGKGRERIVWEERIKSAESDVTVVFDLNSDPIRVKDVSIRCGNCQTIPRQDVGREK